MSPISVITRACARVPPLWPLTHFVAANPFVGWTDVPFGDAVAAMERATHGRLLPGPAPAPLPSVADALDDFDPSSGLGNAFVVDEISKWCAAYFDGGQAVWALPWRDAPLWLAWKAASAVDRTAELRGLPGFRARVAALDDDPVAVVADAMYALALTAEAREPYLLRLLMSVRGWAGHVQYRVRAHEQDGRVSDELIHLLAIRATYDRALYDAVPAVRTLWMTSLATAVETVAPHRTGALCEEESVLQQALAADLARAPHVETTARPALQVVHCIDVRSERLRRALEAQSPAIETIGAAGFFGIPLAYHADAGVDADAHCPVLVTPTVTASETQPRATSTLDRAWQSVRSSASAAFAYVETCGLGAIGALWRAEWAPSTPAPHASLDAPLPLDRPIGDRVALAAGFLTQIGLTRRFASTILLCGHGAHSENNPYASALDCGACGGRSGFANARAAATLLNDPWVRFGLTATGIVIPAETTFVAALHDTVSDDVATGAVDATVRAWLDAASAAVRRERAASLAVTGNAPAVIDRAVRARGRDWATVRPEWALAGNAAFVAAPRARTRGVDLDGRVFLHDYDAALDRDGDTLAQILSAPAVVAMWINLQYFVSTADNDRWGSGNKLLHNVVGGLGVVEGNGGDLRLGLPWQSVHDGVTSRHTPVRLSVFVEAPIATLTRVLARQRQVETLVKNGWMHLLAIDPETGTVRRWQDQQWERLPAAEATADEALFAARRRRVHEVHGVDEREVVAKLA